MENVKVTKEVADALCDRLKWITPWEIVGTSARNGWDERGRNNCGCLNARNLHLDTLIKALYVGYEIEETAEEIIKRKVEKLRKTRAEYQALDVQLITDGQMEGIKFTLDALGIEIEGVNA